MWFWPRYTSMFLKYPEYIYKDLSVYQCTHEFVTRPKTFHVKQNNTRIQYGRPFIVLIPYCAYEGVEYLSY